MTTTDGGFRHRACLYADEAEFLDGTLAFVRDAVEAREPIMIMLDAAKIALLRSTLGVDAELVQFTDSATLGPNPARTVPVWQAFVGEHGGDRQQVRGIGEPLRAGFHGDELVGRRQHEALLNVAFSDAPGFSLLCPYDITSLDPTVVSDAHRTHPAVGRGEQVHPSDRYSGVDFAELLEESLADPPEGAEMYPFGSDLAAARRAAVRYASVGGFEELAEDVALVVGELVTNSVSHGGGRGSLSMWRDGPMLIFEVRDHGHITDPLVGRRRPAGRQRGGRGLWIVNQLCDLVQIRSTHAGTAVRVRISPR